MNPRSRPAVAHPNDPEPLAYSLKRVVHISLVQTLRRRGTDIFKSQEGEHLATFEELMAHVLNDEPTYQRLRRGEDFEDEIERQLATVGTYPHYLATSLPRTQVAQ